jgi:hypothetical protein
MPTHQYLRKEIWTKVENKLRSTDDDLLKNNKYQHVNRRGIIQYIENQNIYSFVRIGYTRPITPQQVLPSPSPGSTGGGGALGRLERKLALCVNNEHIYVLLSTSFFYVMPLCFHLETSTTRPYLSFQSGRYQRSDTLYMLLWNVPYCSKK